MKKIIALLAIAFGVVAPSSVLAADFRATLHVVASPNDGGAVTVSHDGYQHGSTLATNKTFTFTVTAAASQDWSFVGWFENEACTGDPKSKNASYDYSITVSTKDYDTKESKAIPGWYAKERTLYAKFVQHTHAFAYSISGDTITKTCTVTGCPYPDGVAGSATLTANDATYTGKAYAASVTKTGDVATELTYSTETAPIDAGTYSVTMKVDGGEAENSTLTKPFKISAAEITALTLEPTSFNYDGTAKTVSIKSVKAGTLTLTESDYDVSGDAMTQIGSLYETETYTVTVTGKGNYTGTASATWTIKAPTGEFDADALSTSAPGCTADGNTVTVTDSTALAYVAENTWRVNAVVKFPVTLPTTSMTQDDPNVKYIDEAHAIIECEDGIVTKDIKNKQYKLGSLVLGDHNYIDTITWTVDVTLAEITAAIAEQKTELTYELSAGALVWTHSAEGIKPTTYTLTIPLEGIVLNDENGNQVYPHVDFVAQIGLKKFATLGAALDVVEEGETVTLIDEAEADDFAVPAGATLDLVGFGNAAATYEIGAIEDKSATIKSTKEETVTAVTGYEVEVDTTTEPGVYIYTAKLAHQHSWTFEVEEDGITLTATCENPSCTIEGATLQLQLQGVEDKAYDGSGISPAIVDIEKEGYKFREVIEGVEVGEITYERPEYSAGKWYTGAYTASCVVTIDETPYTLTKDFEITKPEGGYTSGFEAQGVGGYDVRFDTLAEAAKAANDGDTIYYKGGNLTGKDITFSSSKDITLDLGGKEIWHNEAEDVTITNAGEGTVTLINGTIRQPYGGWIKTSKQISISGNFVFGEGILVVNEADLETNRLTITMKSGALRLESGAYQCKFKEGGGDVEIIGGVFEKNDACNPTPFIPEGYICKILKTEAGEVYAVVAHTHEFAYSAAGNVITATCAAEDHEYCGYGEETLTLTAEDREATGEPYDGASIEYSENFPVKEAEIVYFDGDQELPSAPTEVGEEYIAKVTVEDATAEDPFAITHIHQFSYDALDAMTIGIKCTTEIGACEFQYWKRATLTADDTKTYDGTPYAASFELEEDFPTDYVTVSLEYWVKNGEKLEDAPSAVGDYTVKMVTSEGDTPKYTLEKDFDIAPADLSGATITLSETSFNFDGYEKSVSISSVKFGNLTLTEGVDYEISEESVLKAAGEGRVDETFTVKIESIEGGNFVGEATTTWTIVAGKERDDFKFGAGTASGEYGEVVDKTLTITDSTKLVYEGEGTWSMAMDIAMPIDGNVGEHFVPTIRLYFRNPETGEIVIASNDDDCKNIGVDITSSKTLMGNYYYITKVVWTEKISLDEIEDAILAGDDKIVRTMKMWSPKWEQEIIRNVLTYDNHDGLPVTEYKMELPLADLVLPVSADTELRMEGTMFANDAEFDAYELLLGKGAKVYGDPNYEDEEGYFGYLPNEGLLKTDVEGYNVGCDDSDESNIFYTTVAKKYNLAYEFVDEDGAPLDGVTNPYKDKKTYTIEDEIIFSEAATLEGYEFIEWSPAKIEKGTTGKQTITGIFKVIAVPPTAVVTPTVVTGLDGAASFELKTGAIGYDDWNVDFIVTTDKDVGEGVITLKGSDPRDPVDPTALVEFPPTAFTANEPVKLLASQGITISYAQLTAVATSYTCGVKNNSLSEDTEFTIQIVLSKEGEEDIIVEGSTFVATLNANILPTATVTPITEEDYEAAVEFAMGKIGAGYDNWTAEFVLTSDVAIGADEIYLAGSYEAYLDGAWVEIPFPGCAADEEIGILKLVGYNDITVKTAFDVIKSFKCGVKNIALKNDATFTLKLVITDGETTKEICSIDGLTVEKKAIDPVVPGEDIIIPEGKDAHEYAAEIEAKKATLLKAPITLEGDELATYQSYFTAQVVDVTVQFVLNDEGEAAVEAASEAAKREALAVALSADETTFTPSAPLKGFYHSLKQGGDFLALAFNVEGDKNKIGDDISFELMKPSDKGFYRLIITPTPYKE